MTKPFTISDGSKRAIEEIDFPFEHLSNIAEQESWRKEVNRPTYHIHKWWAQRLGTVFRAILIGAAAPAGTDVEQLFYEPTNLDNIVIFDPFMGSGTTIGEALKLGARAIGRDINPVSYFIVKNALRQHQREQVLDTFRQMEADTAPILRDFYQAEVVVNGEQVNRDVLYYFWVKVTRCPQCQAQVDLFPSYIFSRHAYPTKVPNAKALCPNCHQINDVRYDSHAACCWNCDNPFDPSAGTANGAKAHCPAGHIFAIADAFKKQDGPPMQRLFAKMVLNPDGSKDYLPIDGFDHALYNRASDALRLRQAAYPVVKIEPGYNTNQVLNYCYHYWHQMFNDRQLLSLSILSERINAIEQPELRELFACLFSGTLEFNNMFASFKGEGTGAVRHMFAHHILKPERLPLEANLWGTPKSSGAFSSLFKNRILRAIDYNQNPFELKIVTENGKQSNQKIFGLSRPIGDEAAESYGEFGAKRTLYLSCGTSATTDIAPGSVDLVATDPPFFDNVHYSQLADFFHVWQRFMLANADGADGNTTRSLEEVQQSDPTTFTERLTGVWQECYRVLKPDGLLVFTYHHSRSEGWHCILNALRDAGFAIVASHPIKSEMSVAAPKQQAKEPIDLDIILVCRKRERLFTPLLAHDGLFEKASSESETQVIRFGQVGRRLSRNDVRIVLMGQIILRLSQCSGDSGDIDYWEAHRKLIEEEIERLHERQAATTAGTKEQCQTTLF